MEENPNQKIKSEEDFEGIKFAECFSNTLNVVALGIIVVIMFLLFRSSFSDNSEKKGATNEIKIQYVQTGNDKIDTEKFSKLINEKFKEYKEQLKDSEKERNESMKYYATLVSFILAIVGFFGFKSMHDTRQAAIEKAVFDAKKEATDVAKKEATNVAKDVANEEAKKEAKKVSKIEIDRYLTDEHTELFSKLEAPIRSYYDPIIQEYSNRIDNLERPGIYNNEINDFNDKITKIYIEMNDRINKLEKELIEKEIELLKLKMHE